MYMAPKLSYLAVIVLASVLILFTVYSHFTFFSHEYSKITWIGAVGPNIITGAVILMCLGYIIMLVTSGSMPSLSIPPSSIPPPATATNSLTRAIGNSMINTGLVNEQPGAMNAFESGLSKRV